MKVYDKNSLLNDFGFKPEFKINLDRKYYNGLPYEIFGFDPVIQWLKKLYIFVDTCNKDQILFSMIDLKKLGQQVINKEKNDLLFISKNFEEFTINDMIVFLSIPYQQYYENDEIDKLNNSELVRITKQC